MQSSEGRYLLVFEPHSSWLYKLPREGELVIGRAESAAIRLHDHQVSRQHAVVTIDGDDVRIRDLDSVNGTRVNGEEVTGPRPLVSGDVITICGVTLVFHSNDKPRSTGMLEMGALRQRAEEEVDRAMRFNRPLTVVAVALGTADFDRAEVEKMLTAELSALDKAAWAGQDGLLALLPETPAERAPLVAERLLGAFRRSLPTVKVGFATCPSEGCDVATLLAAAPAARAGAAARAFETRQIGERAVVIADPVMIRLYALIERLAAVDLPVLIGGETGTGKELVASALHAWSGRREQPLMALNCAALTETLVESELFGHEKGAFSGAIASKAGLFEAAGKGTVFLDEVGELSLSSQAKLLRVLESRRVTRVGDVRQREIDIRLVAATNRNLQDEVKAGRFREDLFFRLSGGMIWLPPLRDRKRELPMLAQAFLDEACARAGREPMLISDLAMRTMLLYAWPGNVRQLKNVMEYVAAAFPDAVVDPGHLSDRLGGTAPGDAAGQDIVVPAFRPLDEEVRELEKNRMSAALVASGGNQTRAAELIGMPVRTFFAKVKQYDLKAEKKRGG